MPAARERKTSEVPVGRPVGAVAVGGMMCSEWRRRPNVASSSSSRVDGETSLGDRCLVDSHAPHHEHFDVSVDVVLIKISVILVGVDVFNAGVDCDENECEGG